MASSIAKRARSKSRSPPPPTVDVISFVLCPEEAHAFAITRLHCRFEKCVEKHRKKDENPLPFEVTVTAPPNAQQSDAYDAAKLLLSEEFLAKFSRVVSVDLSSLPQNMIIGNSFLEGAYVEKLFLPDAVCAVGKRFLCGCPKLSQTPFISSLRNMTSTPQSFMSQCPNLSHVDLGAGLRSLTCVGDDFFAMSESLLTIDLACLTRLSEIGSAFLFNCVNLKRLDCTPLGACVTRIGPAFAAGGANLREVNLDGLSQVCAISSFFLENCQKLRVVRFGGWKSCTSIDSHCLAGCESLQIVDMSGLTHPSLHFKSAGYFTSSETTFLSRCPSLSSVTLPERLREIVVSNKKLLELANALIRRNFWMIFAKSKSRKIMEMMRLCYPNRVAARIAVFLF